VTTSYPGAVDNLTNPTPSDTLNSATVPHAAQHANSNDAIEAIQNTLGVNPQGPSATVKDRIVAVEGAVINLGLAVDDRVPGETGSNAPVGTLPNGYVWVDTSDNSIKVWNGSAWVDPSNAGGGGAAGIPWAAVTGGTVTEYTKADGSVMEVHTFTTNGSLTVDTPGYADVLIVGSGGRCSGPSVVGSGGRIVRGLHALPSGALAVAVGQAVTSGSSDTSGFPSTLGDINTGVVGIAGNSSFIFPGTGAGGTNASPRTGFTSSITGSAVVYAPAGDNTKFGGGEQNGAGVSAAGVVIVAVQKTAPTASGVVASGGTETTYVGDGSNGVLGQSYKVHTFTAATGSLVVTQGGEVDVLILGAGGGYSSPYVGNGGDLMERRLTLAAGTVPVTVGQGGVDGVAAGGSSALGTLVTSIAAWATANSRAIGAGGTVAAPNAGRASTITGTSIVYGAANVTSPVANLGQGRGSGESQPGSSGVVIVRYKV
jgi:hypothetical protein